MAIHDRVFLSLWKFRWVLRKCWFFISDRHFFVTHSGLNWPFRCLDCLHFVTLITLLLSMHLLLTKLIPEGAACNTMPFCYTDTRMRGPLELKVDSVKRNSLEKPSNSIIGCSVGVSSFLWNAWEKPLNRFPCSTVQTRKPLKLSIWQILSCQSVIRPWFSSSSTCDQPWAQVSHSTRAQTCVRSRETLLRAVWHQLSHCCPVCQLLSLLVDLPPMVQSWLSSYHSHLINYYLPSDTFIQKHMFLHSFWFYYWRGLIVQWWQLFTMNECWCRRNWARQSRLKNGG